MVVVVVVVAHKGGSGGGRGGDRRRTPVLGAMGLPRATMDRSRAARHWGIPMYLLTYYGRGTRDEGRGTRDSVGAIVQLSALYGVE